MKIQTTKVYSEITNAISNGFTTISEQGASRSGKTRNTCIFLVVYALTHQNKCISVVRATQPAIRRSVFRDFKDVLVDMGILKDGMINKTSFTIQFDSGSFIEFFSTDDEQKIRGSKRNVLYVNEANELKFIEWQQLKMRTTEFAIMDYNPSFSDSHWICDVNKEEKTYHFITTYKDNPFLEQTIIDEIESLKWKNPSLWQVYGLGQMAIVEGLVFPNFEEIDKVPDYAKYKHRYLGIDMGYSSDPTAIVDVCFHNDGMYIDEVCYKTHMKTNDIIRELKEYEELEEKKFEIISESADPRLVDEIYAAGLDIKPVRKYAGSILAGIMKMQEFKIYITKRSVNLIKEFKNYTYRQDKEGNWLNEPIDAFNHCFTADTMVLTSEGYMRINEVREGDFVATSEGFKPVNKVFDNGIKHIKHVKLSFAGFSVELKATPNHNIKTKDGWRQIKDLKKGDVLFIHRETKLETTWSIRNSTGKCTTDIKEKDIFQEAQTDCTVSSGSFITDVFRKVIISTTKTATHQTTQLKTSKCKKNQTICGIILSNIIKMKNILFRHVRTWLRLPNTQKNGIVQKRGGNGTQNTAKRFLKISSLSNSCASNAENTSLKNRMDISCFALTTANQNGEELTSLMTKRGNAKCAVVNLSQTDTAGCNFVDAVALEDITVLSERMSNVYDLEVDGTHEYFANGVLVHNCIDGVRYIVLEKILGGRRQGLSASQILDIL